MKKVLVINSPLSEQSRDTEDYLPPIGLGIIATSIRDLHEVIFIDALADGIDCSEMITLIEKSTADAICINIFTTNYQAVKSLVEKVRIKTHWIIGGISTKSLYLEIFNWRTDNIISIVYGDGELIVRDLISGEIREAAADSTVLRNYYEVTEGSRYFVNDISDVPLDRSYFSHEPIMNIHGDLEICIYTSRGCPYDCAYCVAAYSMNKGMKIRKKATENLSFELMKISRDYLAVRAIRILDDLFLMNRASFELAAELFGKLRFSWRAMCHIQSIMVVPDVCLTDLQESGCRELFIGIESGSERILEKIGKTSKKEMIIDSICRLFDAGIDVKGYFICGFPGEEKDDLEKTLFLAGTLKKFAEDRQVRFRNSTFQFRPYCGTKIYDEILEQSGMPYNSILTETAKSEKINLEVREKDFNYDSGNYSAVSDNELVGYIKTINGLNNETV